MNKQFFLSVLLLLFSTSVFTQNNTIDSLKLALKNAKHDTTRCNILNAMVEVESDDAIWPKYNEQILTLIKENQQKYRAGQAEFLFFKKNYANALNNIGFLYQSQGNMQKALGHYIESLKIHEEIGNKNGIAATLGNIGALCLGKGDIPKALNYMTLSSKILEQIGDKKNFSSSLNNIGTVYKYQGNIVKALEYYAKSLKVQEEIGDKDGITVSFGNIGDIYDQQGDVSKALECYKKSLDIAEEIGNKRYLGINLSNIGGIYKSKGDATKALSYYNKGLKIQEEIIDKKGMAISLNNIGDIYKDKGDLTKALELYSRGLKIQEEMEDKESMPISLSNIGTIYFIKQSYSKALEYSTKSMLLSKDLGFPETIKNSAAQLHLIYSAIGNYKLAYENYQLYITMRDSIENQENKKASIKSQFKYEYEKKATADSVKVAEEKKIVAVQLKQEKTQRFALYGGLAIVIVFAGFMFNRFRITQKQKYIIELKEKETQLQKNIIEEKHKEITDSINYAERIQRSFLASKELLDENLKNYFVFFKPKDVVSGDFYWSAKLSNGNFALVTADSTGHGVPGAIMSLLNVTSLEKAIEHHSNPAEILNHTRQTIIERLKKDGSEEGGKDGMDCSLLVFDFANKQLFIAAANNPVWIIRSNSPFEGGVRRTGDVELIEIKPDKMPVGKNDKQDLSFTTHTVELQKGDTIYTLTDGFPDQFGGDKGKKFMSKKLKELLLANVHLPIPQQKGLLDSTFKNWVGDLEQVDDVCIIGIKV